MGGGCGFPSRLERGQTPGNRTRREATPRPLPSWLLSSGEPSVCNGFSSPETVVLHQTLLNPQPGDSSSAAQDLRPPPGPGPPLFASVLTTSSSTSSSSSSRHPRHIPTPHPNFGDRERESQIPEEEGGANPHGFAIGLGTGRHRGGKEGEGQRKKEVNRLGSGRLGALPPLPLARSLWLSAEVSSPPALRPPLCPYSGPRAQSIRPKPPALFSLIFHFLFSP